jgi:tetratricopeptide (TPR) repeat protein
MFMLAETSHELGNVYRARDDGDRDENLEKAIEAYEQALNYWPSQGSVEWAATQNALGIAYDLRKRGDRKENIEHAIEAYKQALASIRASATLAR